MGKGRRRERTSRTELAGFFPEVRREAVDELVVEAWRAIWVILRLAGKGLGEVVRCRVIIEMLAASFCSARRRMAASARNSASIDLT